MRIKTHMYLTENWEKHQKLEHQFQMHVEFQRIEPKSFDNTWELVRDVKK